MTKVDIVKLIDMGTVVEIIKKGGENVWEKDRDVKFFKQNTRFRYKEETGTNIDFCMKFMDMRFGDAVNYLYDFTNIKAKVENNNNTLNNIKELKKEFKEQIKETAPNWEEIIQDTKHINNYSSYRYLTTIRKIDKDIFSFFYNRGIIYHGETESRRWNSVKEKNIKQDDTLTYYVYKNPLNGEITGLTGRENRDYMKLIGLKPFRINYSNTEWGFGFLKGKAETIMFFESPIDLLSYLSINKLKGIKQNDTYYCATGGANYNLMLNNIKNLNPSQVVIAFDNDDFGDKTYNFIKENFENTKRLNPENKDWNEDLIELKK